MADTQQENTPQRKTPAQKAAERKKQESPEQERGPLDMLREQAGTMGIAVVAVTVVLLLFVYNSDKSAAFNADAWRDLATLKASAPAGDEGYEELAKKYGTSDAAPFIRLAWASRLYASGLRPKIEQAKSIYEQVLKANPANTFIQNLVPGRIAEIEAELSSDHAPLLDVAAPPPNLDEDDPEGMGDDADAHAGHDHGPGEGHDDEAPEDSPSDDAEAPADGE